MPRMSIAERIGIVAALTSIATGVLYLFRRDSAEPSSPSGCTEAALRAAIVKAARSQIGKAELDTYFADAAPMYVGHHPEWCGIFALWCMHQAGLGKSVMWKPALGFVEPQRFPRVTNPKPGDVAYYDQPFQHQAIVAAVTGDTIEQINGNGSGGVVSVSYPSLSKATVFYSAQKWIDEAIARGCP